MLRDTSRGWKPHGILPHSWTFATRTQDIPAKDVWGNEDPGRREREKMRIDANDPLAAMKMGVRQLRDVEKERKEWEEERKKELKALKGADKESRRRRRRRSRSA
ncbi:hypothetical protein CIHG_00495 [Coccidioides immitis H538.4]|uniref:Uncharacterized protein n=1 Tax=Coccidioides immitis H538.4 TaxID=396776 RepID=A0A0J8RFH3_COCIT|nr:hypothetical protein CIHG_00495 [Coccidioides immitis H538.4]